MATDEFRHGEYGSRFLLGRLRQWTQRLATFNDLTTGRAGFLRSLWVHEQALKAEGSKAIRARLSFTENNLLWRIVCRPDEIQEMPMAWGDPSLLVAKADDPAFFKEGDFKGGAELLRAKGIVVKAPPFPSRPWPEILDELFERRVRWLGLDHGAKDLRRLRDYLSTFDAPPETNTIRAKKREANKRGPEPPHLMNPKKIGSLITQGRTHMPPGDVAAVEAKARRIAEVKREVAELRSLANEARQRGETDNADELEIRARDLNRTRPTIALWHAGGRPDAGVVARGE